MQVEARSPSRGYSRELRTFATISLYLYACLAAVLVHQGSALGADGVPLAAHGLAALEALVLAMAFLAIHALRIGDGFGTLPMVVVIVYRTLIFLVILVAVTLVEEIVAALASGQSMDAALALLADDAWRERAASLPLMGLLFAPCFAVRELGEALGACTVRRMLLGGAI